MRRTRLPPASRLYFIDSARCEEIGFSSKYSSKARSTALRYLSSSTFGFILIGLSFGWVGFRNYGAILRSRLFHDPAMRRNSFHDCVVLWDGTSR